MEQPPGGGDSPGSTQESRGTRAAAETLVLLRLIISLWFVAVVGGVLLLERRAATPGLSAAPARWPAGTRLVRETNRATLLLFAHAKCVCTAATITELARILDGTPARPAVTVVIAGGDDTSWVAESARERGWRVHVDELAAETERFGAATSGFVELFAPDGARLFGGGVTVARGHAGVSAGGNALEAALTRGSIATMRVFGCELGGSGGGS